MLLRRYLQMPLTRRTRHGRGTAPEAVGQLASEAGTQPPACAFALLTFMPPY